MFLNNKEAAGRFSSSKNIIGKIATKIISESDGLKNQPTNKSNHEGEIPEVLKPAIAQAAALSSSRDAGEIFGVNKNTANAIRKEFVNKEEAAIKSVRDLAVGRVNACLKNITDEKLQDNGAKTLSEIARNLSSVIRNTTPEKAEESSRFALNIISPVVMGEGWRRGEGLGKQSAIEVFPEEETNREAVA